ncbi:hypothetical protein ABIB27_003342 [Arthrobacter sp. UYEF21]
MNHVHVVAGSDVGDGCRRGSGIAWLWKIPPKLVSTVMAFGAGVLISALALELVQDAAEGG